MVSQGVLCRFVPEDLPVEAGYSIALMAENLGK